MVRFVAFGLGLSALVSVSTACSSTSTNPSEQVTPKPTCPAFVHQAVAHTTMCTAEGYVCGIGYACGSFSQQATCTCTHGGFACVAPDGKGGTIDIPADTPETEVSASFCISQPNPVEACPMDVTAAQGKVCATAGKTCYYSGVNCPNFKDPLTDNCYCESSVQTLKDGGTNIRLTWNCTVSACK